MTSLAPHADQAVRHAVDAYIDGRLLPTFEGDASFETRNSRYRLLDGVLLSAPDHKTVGAEMVGWLVEYVSRSEVIAQWRHGARAVLVDTRNDGVRGPQIVITSATRTFRSDRIANEAAARSTFDSAPRGMIDSAPRVTSDSAPRITASTLPPMPYDGSSRGLLPATAAPHRVASPAPHAGSFMSQSGSTMPPPAPASLAWEALPAPAPVPTFRGPSLPRTLPPPPPPLPMYRQPGTIPPPPMVVSRAAQVAPPPPPPRPLPRAASPGWHQPLAALPVPLPPQPPAFADEVAARKIVAAIEASMMDDDATEDSAPTIRNERRSTARLAYGRGASQRDARQSGSRLPPPPPMSVPFLLSRPTASAPLPPPRAARAHQRGMPLR